jgi:hypothetical protein
LVDEYGDVEVADEALGGVFECGFLFDGWGVVLVDFEVGLVFEGALLA